MKAADSQPDIHFVLTIFWGSHYEGRAERSQANRGGSSYDTEVGSVWPQVGHLKVGGLRCQLEMFSRLLHSNIDCVLDDHTILVLITWGVPGNVDRGGGCSRSIKLLW